MNIIRLSLIERGVTEMIKSINAAQRVRLTAIFSLLQDINLE